MQKHIPTMLMSYIYKLAEGYAMLYSVLDYKIYLQSLLLIFSILLLSLDTLKEIRYEIA